MTDLLPETRIERRNFVMEVEAVLGYPSTIYILFWRDLGSTGMNLYRVVGHSGREYGFFDWHPTKESSIALMERSLRLFQPKHYARFIKEGRVKVELF